MKRGRLIVFEGIDGVGKATQVARLAAALKKEGGRVMVFTSPRYDLPTGKLVRRALLGEFGDFVALSPYLSALPYFNDFAAWRDEVLAALKKGDVVCDRYVYSTLAYASAKLSGAKQAAFLKEVSDIAFKQLKLPKADRVIFLDVPVAASQKLMAQKKKDQFEKNTAYQKKVAAVYVQLSKGKEWRVVSCTKANAMRTREDIAADVLRSVKAR